MKLNKLKYNNKEKESIDKIYSFQEEHNILLSPGHLSILLNYGEIKYDYKHKHFFNNNEYKDVLIDCIPAIDTLRMWLDNHWYQLMDKNENLNSNYLPILNTYSPNLTFLVGVNESNLDEIFLYDDDFENFKPQLIASNIWRFFEEYIEPKIE